MEKTARPMADELAVSVHSSESQAGISVQFGFWCYRPWQFKRWPDHGKSNIVGLNMNWNLGKDCGTLPLQSLQSELYCGRSIGARCECQRLGVRLCAWLHDIAWCRGELGYCWQRLFWLCVSIRLDMTCGEALSSLQESELYPEQFEQDAAAMVSANKEGQFILVESVWGLCEKCCSLYRAGQQVDEHQDDDQAASRVKVLATHFSKTLHVHAGCIWSYWSLLVRIRKKLHCFRTHLDRMRNLHWRLGCDIYWDALVSSVCVTSGQQMVVVILLIDLDIVFFFARRKRKDARWQKMPWKMRRQDATSNMLLFH